MSGKTTLSVDDKVRLEEKTKISGRNPSFQGNLNRIDLLKPLMLEVLGHSDIDGETGFMTVNASIVSLIKRMTFSKNPAYPKKDHIFKDQEGIRIWMADASCYSIAEPHASKFMEVFSGITSPAVAYDREYLEEVKAREIKAQEEQDQQRKADLDEIEKEKKEAADALRIKKEELKKKKVPPKKGAAAKYTEKI